jgi:electron-transferring-flavoprotein dehydrogenase
MIQEELLARFGPRESMEYDVVIVGGGPAGLAAAIRLKQMAKAAGRETSVAVLEKGSEPGAHTLSGAVIDPRALSELIPDWKALGAPLHQPVTDEIMLFMSEKRAFRTPGFLLPPPLRNHGNYIVSLGNVVRWLAQQAEEMGVEIFAGFAATELLFDGDGAVVGVATGHVGLGKDGEPTPEFQLGVELRASYTIFAEGARGQLGRQLVRTFGLDAGKDPQAYGIGIKEIWEIDPARHRPGLVLHGAGWPLDGSTYGGSFMYHAENNQVFVGFVVGLDYRNPYLSPFEEFQRFKTHPNIRWYFESDAAAQDARPARRISYGARAYATGGLLSLPKTVFPGGALVGCDAGYLNASRIKGSHAAIKTGMLAAEAAFEAIAAGRRHDELLAYPIAFERSWLHAELRKDRNFKRWFGMGRLAGTLMTGVEQWLLRGHFPWSLHKTRADHEYLRSSSDCQPIDYPRPDGKLTFDRLSSVFLSNTHHAENQPAHLTLKDPAIPVDVNLRRFAGPEGRYCPAGVYEFIESDNQPTRLQINAQNCVHCKTCDIKDPGQNIVWVAPEGGGGPNYAGM